MISLDQTEANIPYLAPSSHKHYLITELLIGILTLWNREKIILASKLMFKTLEGILMNFVWLFGGSVDISNYLRSCHQDTGIWASSWPYTPWRSACSSQAWPIRCEYYGYRPIRSQHYLTLTSPPPPRPPDLPRPRPLDTPTDSMLPSWKLCFNNDSFDKPEAKAHSKDQGQNP